MERGSGIWRWASPGGPSVYIAPQDIRKHPGISRILGPGVDKIGHDLKTAWVALRRAAVAVGGVSFDTRLAAYCLNSTSRFDFPSVQAEYGGDASPKGTAAGDLLIAALEQTRQVHALAGHLRAALEDKGLLSLYQELELPLVEVLADMEVEGVGLDSKYLRSLSREFEDRIVALKLEMDRLAGYDVNPNSPKQIGRLLFEELKLPIVHKTPKGGASTDESALEVLSSQHPLPAKFP